MSDPTGIGQEIIIEALAELRGRRDSSALEPVVNRNSASAQSIVEAIDYTLDLAR